MTTVALDRLGRLLGTRPDVIFAVVFGSGRSGTIPEGSDLDVGILFDRQPDPETLIALLTEMADTIAFDRIDYVDLRAADPILGFEAISGLMICKNDPAKTAEHVSLICREYEDVMWRLNHAA